MKKNAGFNLVELMVALALGAVLLEVVTQAFTSVLSNYIFTRNQLQVQQGLRYALLQIRQDLQNAGVFANFSLRNQCISNAQHSCASAAYNYIVSSTPSCTTSEWCQVDSETLGIKSDSSFNAFSHLMLALSAEGVSLNPNSEVVRIQRGGSHVAYFTPNYSCNDPAECTFIRCNDEHSIYYKQIFLNKAVFTNSGLDATNGPYFLASANHGYLLNFAAAAASYQAQVNVNANQLVVDFKLGSSRGCPALGEPYIRAESAVEVSPANYLSYDPDSYSLALTNLLTRYYFVGTKAGVSGLYVKSLSSDGSLTPATLVAAQVTALNLNFMVKSQINQINNFPPQAKYRWLSSAAVTNANLWQQISGVNVSLTGELNQDQDTQPIVETISLGWRQ